MAKNRKSVIKRIFWFLSLLILIVICTAITLAYVYEAEVKQYVVSQINEQSDAKIKVEKIELSFLKRFPMASLQFHNVEVKENISTGDPANLLTSENIFLKFSVFDLIQNKYVLKDFEMSGAQLNLVIFEDGSNNFQVFNGSEGDSSDFLLKLDKVLLNNFILHYTNYASKQFLDLKVKNIALSGKFSPEEFKIHLKGATQVQKYTSESFTMLDDKSVDLDVILEIDPVSHNYNIQKGNITYNNIPLSISGNIEKPEQGVKLDLKLHSEALSLEQLLQSLPDLYQQKLKDYKLNGTMKIDAKVKGNVVSRSVPSIEIDLRVQDAEIRNIPLEYSLKDLHFSALYSNGKSHSLSSSVIQIREFGFSTNEGVFEGKGSLQSFIDSRLQLQLHADLNLDELIKFTGKVYGIKELSGKAGLDLKIGGIIHGLIGGQEIDYSGLDFQARLGLKGCNLRHKASDVFYENMVGDVRINSHSIVIEPTQLSINGSQQNLRAEIQNYKNWFLAPEQNKLIIRSTADISKLAFTDIQQILGASEGGDGSFPKNIDLRIKFEADTFLWQNMLARNAKGVFTMNNQILSFNQIRFDAFEGKIVGNCSINGVDPKARPIVAKGNLAKIDINNLFSAFHNFDQDVITEENIKGKLTSDFIFNALFDREWNMPSNSIALESNLLIEGGELNNIKELNALSNYTKIDDFSHIQFSKLENSIQISNRILRIPEMLVKSNKLDLEVAGTHDFDNKYDYHMSVLMSDIMFKNVKEKSENEFGEVQSDGYGRTKLFFHVYGQGDDMTVKYDRKGVVNKLKDDLKEEGTSLKSALNKEFGWFKNSQDTIPNQDTIKKTTTKKQQKVEDLKEQEEGKFIFEWDDEEEESQEPPEEV